MKKLSQDDLIKQFRVITDTREQLPYHFIGAITKGLPCGDYSICYGNKTYENEIIIERKGAVSEIFSACGKERERFENELEKLAKIKYKWIIAEFSLLDLVNFQPPGIMNVSAVYGSLISWTVKYNVPVIFCQNRSNGRSWVYKLFYFFVKYEILKII